MSLFDQEISKSIWNGKIPIRISLDPIEIDIYGSNKVWDPIYLEVSRCCYFPLITKKVQTLLVGLGIQVPENSFGSVWYDYEGQPLKWHYPIGLLYDMHSKPNSLPWSVTLHFSNLPTDKILLKPTVENMQDMFMAMVKEADFLRNGSTKKVMNLSKRDHGQLWQSLTLDSYDDFWAVNRQLIESSINLRNIPLRIYLPKHPIVIQELISYYDSESEKRTSPTISQVITKIIPELGKTLALGEEQKQVSIVIHGIDIPLDTPIDWAYQHLCFADNFLHVAITTVLSLKE